jgi:hypothetical protein
MPDDADSKPFSMPDDADRRKTVAFTGQFHGGGVELGGNYTEAEAEIVRSSNNRMSLTKQPSRVMRIIRGTIFREPSGLEEISAFTSVSDDGHSPHRSSTRASALEDHPDYPSGNGGRVVLLLSTAAIGAAVAAGVYVYRMWLEAKARAEAERAAREAGGLNVKVLLPLMLLGLLLGACALSMSRSASEDASDEHPDKRWRRRSSMKRGGKSPRLRRKNTQYHD